MSVVTSYSSKPLSTPSITNSKTVFAARYLLLDHFQASPCLHNLYSLFWMHTLPNFNYSTNQVRAEKSGIIRNCHKYFAASLSISLWNCSQMSPSVCWIIMPSIQQILFPTNIEYQICFQSSRKTFENQSTEEDLSLLSEALDW